MDNSVEGCIPSALVADSGRQLIADELNSSKMASQGYGLKSMMRDSHALSSNETRCSESFQQSCCVKLIRLHGKPIVQVEELKLDTRHADAAEHEAASDTSSIISENSQTHLLEVDHQKSIESCTIEGTASDKLCPSPSDIIDELDAANEESFTLESFANLIANAHHASKSFIMARVTTADPQDAQKLYHSYYDAQHINKVLFRTQPEASLLHRMRARNPLNNMPVLGDVEYYTISPESVRDAHRQAKKRAARQIILSHLKNEGHQLDHRTLSAFYFDADEIAIDEAHIQRSVSASDITSLQAPRMPLEWLGLERPGLPQTRSTQAPSLLSTSPSSSSSISDIHGTGNTMNNPMAASYVARPTLLSLSYPDLRLDQSIKYLFCPLDDAMKHAISPNTMMNAKLESYTHDETIVSTVPMPSDASKTTAVLPSAALDDKVNTVVYHAVYYGNDDDFLMKGNVREFFKLNSVQPEDAALFTLYRATNGLDANGARARGGFPHSAGGGPQGLGVVREPRNCLNLCGFLSNRSALWRRNTMGGIVLVYIVVSVLVVLMGIPESLRGLVGISLLVLLALMIIIFIDTERTHSAAESMGHLPPV